MQRQLCNTTKTKECCINFTTCLRFFFLNIIEEKINNKPVNIFIYSSVISPWVSGNLESALLFTYIFPTTNIDYDLLIEN